MKEVHRRYFIHLLRIRQGQVAAELENEMTYGENAFEDLTLSDERRLILVLLGKLLVK